MDILRKIFRKKRSMLSALIAAFTMLLLSSSASAASAPNDAEPIPYATFDDAEGILTLSYGEPEEGSFKLYTDGNKNLLYNTGCKDEDVKKVVITESFKDFKPETTDSWFFDFTSLETIEGIGNITTDEVTDMSSMFINCQSLKSLDLSGFNTANVTHAWYVRWQYKPPKHHIRQRIQHLRGNDHAWYVRRLSKPPIAQPQQFQHRKGGGYGWYVLSM